MSLPITKQMRIERRKSAEKRQEEYNQLSLQEKIAKLPPEPEAKKQRTKLLAQLNNSK